MTFTPLERVLAGPGQGRPTMSGHFLSYNHFGDPIIDLHDDPLGDGWTTYPKHQVTGHGEPCDCESARRIRGQI